MGYKSPVDGTELVETKNADGDKVYREMSTGHDYTEEYLKEQEAGQTRAASDSSSNDSQVDEDPNADLNGLKRGELNEVATAEGLNPDDYSNADDLRTAIADNRANQ